MPSTLDTIIDDDEGWCGLVNTPGYYRVTAIHPDHIEVYGGDLKADGRRQFRAVTEGRLRRLPPEGRRLVAEADRKAAKSKGMTVEAYLIARQVSRHQVEVVGVAR